jgi:hypothetical protein
VGVPPLNVSDRVDEPPELIVDGVAVGVPTVNAAFTVTVTVVEVTLTGVPDVSVTCNSKVHTPVVVNAPDEMDDGEVHAAAVPRLLNTVAPGAFCNHWQVNGEVPPLKVSERVEDCPESTVTGDAVGVPTASAALTVTVTVVDVTVTGVPELSLTCNSKVHTPVVVNTPDEMDEGEVQTAAVPKLLNTVAPGAFCIHWHVNGEVPPVNVSDRVEDCPLSMVAGEAVGVPTVSAAFTVTVTVVDVTLMGVPELSVTCNSKVQVPVVVNAPDEIDEGDVHAAAVPRLLNTVAPGAFCIHWQVNGDVPPLKVSESVED